MQNSRILKKHFVTLIHPSSLESVWVAFVWNVLNYLLFLLLDCVDVVF